MKRTFSDGIFVVLILILFPVFSQATTKIGSQIILGRSYDYYEKDNKVYLEDILLDGINSNGFEFFREEFDGFYKNFEGLYHVEFDYHLGHHSSVVAGIKKISKVMQDEVDIKTIEMLGLYLARDKKNLFKIEKDGRSGETEKIFLMLEGISPLTYEQNGRFVWDEEGDAIYWEYSGDINIHLSKVDSDTIQIINQIYVKDKSRVYFEGRPIDGADPKTFKIISNIHTKDKNSVYYWGRKIEQADPETFVETFNDRGRDKNNFFLFGKVVYDEETIKHSFPEQE